MAQLAVKYIANPFQNFWKGILRGFELAGYARAASELDRLGYRKEAESLYERMRNM